jgi:PAS domain S-box-containing protein
MDHEAPLRGGHTNGARILIADADAAGCNSMKRLLGQHYAVEAVSDGNAALRAIEEHQPDLVLTATIMPQLDGFGLLRALRANPATQTIPVVMLSARGGEEADIQGGARSADDYLVKPFSAHELRARVGARLEIARLRRQVAIQQQPTYDALWDREKHYRTLFQLIPTAMYVCDATGVIQEFNRRAVELWGREPERGNPRERFCGAFKLFYPDGRPMPHEKCPMARALQGEEIGANDAEMLVERPDGLRRSIMALPQVVRNERGEIIEALNCLYDVTERKQAEEALREGEQRFREMIDALPVAIYTTDAEGRLTHFNPAAVAFSGRVPGLGTDQWCVTWKLYYPDGTLMPHSECPMAIALKEGRVIEGVEAVAERPDGTRVWFTPYPTPLRNSKGRIVGGINMLFDITERKRAEETRARLAAIVESSDDAIVSKDLNGIIMTWNKGAERIFGYTAEEAVGKSVTILIPPERHDEEPEILRRIRRGESIEHYETVRRHKDGTLLDISLTVSPIVDGHGKIVGASKIARDVTERKRVEENIRDSEEKFRNLADNMSQFAWMTDATGWIFWYNQRWYDYTGTTLEEMQGWGWQKALRPDHVERVVEKIRRCFEAGEIWEDTFPLRGKDGEYRWFLSRAVPIHNEDGRIMRWFGTNTDITEQRELERQKDAFIGIASHELKTPITGIKGYAQLLERRFRTAGDVQAAEMLRKMDRQIDRLTGLVEDLLDGTRAESGNLSIRPTSFDLNGLIDEIIEEIQQAPPQHTIVRDLAASVTLVADRDRIGQVLTNLLTNAIKYSPQADRVIVRTARDGENIVISVQDFGIGIPAGMQPYVFERFFRVEGEDRASYSGLGLGLYIAAEFVKRHGGTIWVESEEGKGATVSFSLPLDRAADTAGSPGEHTE